jgi:hypothetical protein
MRKRAMTPVTITERYPSFGRGRLEAWAAASKDGEWFYKREDAPGTPWVVVHVPTGAWLPGFGTLASARASTASGWVAKELALTRRVFRAWAETQLEFAAARGHLFTALGMPDRAEPHLARARELTDILTV